MKKTLHALGIVIILLSQVILSCSKKDTTTPQSPIIINPIPPAPTGTVIPVNSSINYGERATLNYSFINADSGVYIGGRLMIGQSGSYQTDTLKVDTYFSAVAKGKGGTKTLNPIKITVGLDPRVAFLITGKYHCDSLLFKAYNAIEYIPIASGDCNKHRFYWNNQNSSPGNQEWTIYGNCPNPGNPGDSAVSYWYFSQNDHLFWHGVEFDSFAIVGNGFILHYFIHIIVGGQPNVEEYKQYFARD